MSRLYYPIYRFSWTRISSQSLFFSSLTIIGLVTSLFLWSSKAQAQTPTSVKNNSTIISYSRALLRIESERQQTLEDIKKIVGSRDIPKMVCNDPNSLNSIPEKARDIAVDYCNRSQKIVEEYGLTTEQFNQITVELQNNENLKQEIFNNLIRLQKNPDAQ